MNDKQAMMWATVIVLVLLIAMGIGIAGLIASYIGIGYCAWMIFSTLSVGNAGMAGWWLLGLIGSCIVWFFVRVYLEILKRIFAELSA